MSTTVTERAASVSPSLTLAITAKAKKMQEEGTKLIGFTAGEPDFNTPEYIIKAAKAALDAGKTKYTPSSGILPLRQAICEKLKRDNGLIYTPKQIVISNGAKHSLHNACQALINPGDEVIIPAPYWLTYPELVKIAGGVPVYVDCPGADGFLMKPQQLEAAITPKTKAVFINSPSNPTGAVYSEEDIRALGAVIEKAGIWVISDEIYEHYVYDGAKHFSIAAVSKALYEKTILVNGLSKSYSMTGWRIGYTACIQELASAMDNMQSHTTSNANTIAQYAALEAIGGKDGVEFIKSIGGIFDERRKIMAKRLAKMPHITYVMPRGAFYFMVGINKLRGVKCGDITIKSAHDVADVLLEKANVAVVPGEAFGAPDFIRLSYTLSPADIELGMDMMEKFLRELPI